MILALVILLPACPAPELAAPTGDRPKDVELNVFAIMAGISQQLRVDAIAEALRVEYPDWSVTSLAAGGEAPLISKRIAGEVDYFLIGYLRPLEIEIYAPLHPEIDFEQAAAYSLVMPTSPHYVHFVAMGKTGLTSIREIVDQKYPFKVGTGPGAAKVLFSKILEHYGTSLAEAEEWGAKHETVSIPTPEGLEALQAGRADIGLTWSGIPSPAFMGVTFDLKLLPIDDPGLIGMLEGLGFYESTIPAGTYPFVTEDISTVGDTEFLVVRPDMPEDIVYYTVKALFKHKDILVATHAEFEGQMTAEALANSLAISQKTGIPFHPGALKFYREMGWIE